MDAQAPRRIAGAGALALLVLAGCPKRHAPAPVASGDPDATASATDAPDPSCSAPGCLRSATKIGDYAKLALRAVVDPRVTMAIENGYAVWTIEYVTGSRTSLATVTLPDGVSTNHGSPPARGFDIVGNNHGTTGIDDPCKLAGTVLGAGMAGLFGARGAIGVAPDYPGLGTPGVLPYLVSEIEGRAALDALRAARSLARFRGVPVSNRFAMVGLSEGGHATLAAAAMHASYASDLDVRAFAAAAPASVREEDWRAGFVDGPLVPFQAMFLFAWSEHYAWKDKGPAIWAPGMEKRVRDAMTTECVGALGSTGGLGKALGETSRAKVFASDFIAAYSSGAWGSFDFVGKAFAANRIVPFKTSAALAIYQGSADTIVYEAGTKALVDSLRAGGTSVEYEVVPGATHFDLAFGPLGVFEKRTTESVRWVQDHLR